MDKPQIRAILGLDRAADPACDDPRFREARQEADRDRELSELVREDQEIDRLIAAKLQETRVPAGLKARLSARPRLVHVHRDWTRRALLAAACLIGLAVLFGSWRGPFAPAVTFGEYADEMVSFVRIDPPLSLKTKEYEPIKEFLQKSDAPSRFQLASNLRELSPVGCRVLKFRGRDVSLVCFRHPNGKLMHLFVVDASALPDLARGGQPRFLENDGWSTAAWVEGDQAYLVAGAGGREVIQPYVDDT